jgi:hypothetical protein
VTAHHLDEECALVRSCRHSEAVDRDQRSIEGRGRPDRDVGADQVVVDRGGDTNDRQALRGKRVRACLRAVAANDDQRR